MLPSCPCGRVPQEDRGGMLREMASGLDHQRTLEQRCYGLLCELWGLPAPQV